MSADCGCCKPLESNDRCGGCPSCMMGTAQDVARERQMLLTEFSVLLRRAINGHIDRQKATKWLESKGWRAELAALRAFVPTGEPRLHMVRASADEDGCCDSCGRSLEPCDSCKPVTPPSDWEFDNALHRATKDRTCWCGEYPRDDCPMHTNEDDR